MMEARRTAQGRIPLSPVLLVACCAAPRAAQGEGPTIEVWCGERPRFGALGVPQRWVNILGRVSDPDGVTELSYSLNGAPDLPLSRGPCYSLAVRERGEPEASEVVLQAVDPSPSAPASGCVLFIAHLVDASFGDAVVEPIGPPPPAPAISRISVIAAPRSAEVTWRTPEPTAGRVEYGLTGPREMRAVSEAERATEHRATLASLACGSVYRFRIVSTDLAGAEAASPELSFSTPECRPAACPARRVATPGAGPSP